MEGRSTERGQSAGGGRDGRVGEPRTSETTPPPRRAGGSLCAVRAACDAAAAGEEARPTTRSPCAKLREGAPRPSPASWSSRMCGEGGVGRKGGADGAGEEGRIAGEEAEEPRGGPGYGGCAGGVKKREADVWAPVMGSTGG